MFKVPINQGTPYIVSYPSVNGSAGVSPQLGNAIAISMVNTSNGPIYAATPAFQAALAQAAAGSQQQQNGGQQQLAQLVAVEQPKSSGQQQLKIVEAKLPPKKRRQPRKKKIKDQLNGPGDSSSKVKQPKRTKEDFLKFCDIILDYENYDAIKEEESRRRHASSPFGASSGEGSGSDSFNYSSGSKEDNDSGGGGDVSAYERFKRMQQQNRFRSPSPLGDSRFIHHSEEVDVSFGPARGQKRSFGGSGGKRNRRSGGGGSNKKPASYIVRDPNQRMEYQTDEDTEEISCYCGKPFGGLSMIECSSCLNWIHMKCEGISRRNKIPDVWLCRNCRKQNDKSPSQAAKKSSSPPTSNSAKRKRIGSGDSSASRTSTPSSSAVAGSGKRKRSTPKQRPSSASNEDEGMTSAFGPPDPVLNFKDEDDEVLQGSSTAAAPMNESEMLVVETEEVVIGGQDLDESEAEGQQLVPMPAMGAEEEVVGGEERSEDL